MASKKQNSNKPELVAIYRLEFYKNKKKWKLSNEKPKQPPKPPCVSCVPPKSEHCSKLNRTYCVDSESDLEKEKTSPLNNAFIHVIPTDDPPQDSWEPSAPPPTPQSPDDVGSNHATALGPSQEDRPSCMQKIQQDTWSNQATLASQQPLIQDQEIWTNNSSNKQQISNQNPWPPEQPVNNLQWLLKSNLDTWTNPTDTPRFHQESLSYRPPNLSNSWNDQAMPDASQLRTNIWTNQANTNAGTWMAQPSTADLQDKCSSDTMAPLKSQVQNVYINKEYQHPSQIPHMQYQEKWNSHLAAATPQNLQVNRVPSLQKSAPYNSDLPLPKSSWLNQGQWTSEKIQQDVANLDLDASSGPVSGFKQLPIPGDGFQPPRQDMTNLAPAFDGNCKNSERPQKYEDQWSTQKIFVDQKVQDTWAGQTPPFILDEVGQDIWNQAWQEKQEIWQNKDWDVAPTADVLDGLYDEEDGNGYPEPQHGQEQYSVKPQPAEAQSPAQVRRGTDRWLGRLVALYPPHDDCLADCDSLWDYYQRGYDESADFIREAHDLPHSSQYEPSDSCECVSTHPPPPALCSLSPQRLSAAVRRAAAALRRLLREQIVRDQLKSQTFIKLEEYPTRDTDLFGSDYIMSGSHIPHNTAELSTGTDRVIKIDMGRPYRL